MYYIRYLHYINSFQAYNRRGNMISSPVPDFIQEAVAKWNIRKNISVSSVSGMEAGYSYGNPPPLPHVEPIIIESRKTTRNKDFTERVRKGELIVSPCKISKVVIQPAMGLRKGAPSYISTCEIGTTYQGSNVFKGLGLILERHPANNRLYVRDPFREVWYFFNIVFRYTNNVANISELPPNYDWDSILNPDLVMDTQLVQQVTSKVYSLSVDALTALAEAPETVSSVYSALKSVASATVNYKKNLKKLAALTVKNKNLIILALSKEITRLDQMKPSNRREAQKLNKLRTRARQKSARMLRKEAADNVSRLANAWLAYRYAIMPNYYLIKDVVEARQNMGKSFIREQVSKFETLSLPVSTGVTISGTRTIRHRAWCGVRLRVYSPLDELLGVIQTNPFLTAWELVPLSFVVDWFVGVGDALSTLTPPSGLEQQANSYSWKTEQNLTLSWDNGAAYEVSHEQYTMVKNHTTDFVGIFFNVQINWKRMLDSGALLWSSSIRKRLRY